MQELAPLLGRSDELAAAAHAARPGTVVTVTGPGGVGKSRLVAELVAPLRGAGSARLLWAPLGDLPGDATLDDVVRLLGVDSIDALVVSLGAGEVTVVLDNCEHLLGPVATVVAALLGQRPDVVVLATSRQPLHVVGEQIVPLAPLPLPAPGAPDPTSSPAVLLFLQRAGAGGADWVDDPTALPAVVELCRRLDGLPLAIEIAAARARATGPSELLRLMEHRLDLRRDPVAGGADPAGRHDSIGAAIEVSLEQLPQEDATALRRLGVFDGPFDLDLAHAVVSSPDGSLVRTADVLARLVDRSLVEVEHVRSTAQYRLLELVREHVRRDAALRGHAADNERRFVAAMDAASEELVVAGLSEWGPAMLARSTEQFQNLAAALRRTLQDDAEPDRSLRLMRPMLVAVHQGRSAEVIELGRRVFERWPGTTAEWSAEVQAVLATAAAVLGDVEQVRRWCKGANAGPEVGAIAVVLAERAAALAAVGSEDAPSAARHLEHGRRVAVAAGLEPFARELAGMALAVQLMIDPDVVDHGALDRLLDEARRAGDSVNEALSLLVRARVQQAAGAFDDAAATVRAAGRATEASGYPWWSGAVLRADAAVASAAARAHGQDPWAASAGRWRTAAEATVERGALGELSTTLRAAAVSAWHAGAEMAVEVLLAAAPEITELTVLPDVAPSELRRLVARTPARVGTLPERLRAAMDCMALVATAAPVHTTSERTAAVSPAATHAELRRDGDQWHLEFAGRVATLAHLKGLGDLSVLLASPGVEVHSLQLMGAVDVGGGDVGLDARARREYEARIVELQDELDEARDRHDPVRAERAELELDTLVEELGRRVGLGGRSRSTGSSAERARSAVTYRIRSAIERVGRVHPELGRHLENSVRTGTWCSYRPERPVNWSVRPGA